MFLIYLFNEVRDQRDTRGGGDTVATQCLDRADAVAGAVDDVGHTAGKLRLDADRAKQFESLNAYQVGVDTCDISCNHEGGSPLAYHPEMCIRDSPNGVLRPSADLLTLMQPESSYERGYCRPECTKCSEVCPAGAIRPISVADKSSVQIGHAVWVRENCIPLTDGVECGNCARHCPVGAITMVASDPSVEGSRKIPVVNTERCIGCGACENLCPSRPFSAIYVEGHEVHRTI